MADVEKILRGMFKDAYRPPLSYDVSISPPCTRTLLPPCALGPGDPCIPSVSMQSGPVSVTRGGRFCPCWCRYGKIACVRKLLGLSASSSSLRT